MGYHVPNADAVYQYIFRSDSGKKLTDGFGWSILFINDNSDTCREFLTKYGLELCYRTADRIRFVFFSGLESNEIEKINRHGYFSGNTPYLANIIKTATQWMFPKRKYDWERDPWEEYRPDNFYPLSSHEKIKRHIDMECEIHTAMPGSEEALKFAQRLGIGRFVPCFLFFSDINKETIYLLPAASKNPAQLFTHVRRLIDSFYEFNNLVLTRWHKIEDEIETTSRALESSLYKVDNWKNEQNETWEALQKISRYSNQLSETGFDINLFEKMGSDRSLPWELRNFIGSCLHKLKLQEKVKTVSKEIKVWMNDLKEEPITKFNSNYFSKFPLDIAIPIESQIADLLQKAKEILKPSSESISIEKKLINWWRFNGGVPISRGQYNKYRVDWASFSKTKYNKSAIGNVAEILRNEYQIISDTALSLPITSSPEFASDEIILKLANHLGILTEDREWNSSFDNFKSFLIKYYEQLKTSLPVEIKEIATKLSLNFSWKDCIPTFEQRQKFGVNNCHRQLPLIDKAVHQLNVERENVNKGIQSKINLEKQQIVEKLDNAINNWLLSVELIEADKQSLASTLNAMFSAFRQKLEDKVFQSLKGLSSIRYPGGKFSPEQTTQLLNLLEEYHTAKEEIVFPFENDPDVLRVGLTTSLPIAAGVGINHKRSAVTEARDKLTKSVSRVEKSMGEWDSTKLEMSLQTPSGRLCVSLKKILGPERWDDLLASLNRDSVEGVIKALSTKQEIIKLFNRLSVQELLALENDLYTGRNRDLTNVAATKDALFESILLAISLQYSEGGLTDAENAMKLVNRLDELKKKIEQDEFDVFLAHNSDDKLSILELGEKLRTKGIYPWIDVEQVQPGRWFQDVLQSAIRKVRTAAIVIGTSGIGKWQAVEMRAFLSRCVESGIPLIPVLLPGVTKIPDELSFLRELNLVQFADQLNDENAIARLVWGITGKKSG
jgi:hypothetical protein